MSDFTYAPPDSKPFLHTLRLALVERKEAGLAEALRGAEVEFDTSGSYSNRRWNSYAATVRFTVPVDRLAFFTETMKKRLLRFADEVMPRDVGYELIDIEISPFLVNPTEEEAPLPPTFKPESTILHDHLYFRSQTEIRIYDVMKKKPVLFFANATAVLGGKGERREPDFLVCKDGKWGILEVMGEPYHPPQAPGRRARRSREATRGTPLPPSGRHSLGHEPRRVTPQTRAPARDPRSHVRASR